MKRFDYIIVGAGIAGCFMAYFLRQAQKSVLVLEQHENLKHSASYTAGGFLSPLLGKENPFKTLVSTALKYSITFYKEHLKESITQKGVLRIPKNKEDALKFQSYIPFIDVAYEEQKQGCFFPIGAQVDSLKVCQQLLQGCDTIFNHKVVKLEALKEGYCVDEQFLASKLILTTGANIKLINEPYFQIRPVWGQRIDITTSTHIQHNYHKACSVSSAFKSPQKGKYRVSIGATHHRFDDKKGLSQLCLEEPNKEHFQRLCDDANIIQTNTQALLEKANDILSLNDVEVQNIKFGARACSVDYFPIVGSLVDASKTLEDFPYLTKGTLVPSDRFSYHANLFVLNGLGGRGFVLAPYLANQLTQHLLHNKELCSAITPHRLFKRWVKRPHNI